MKRLATGMVLLLMCALPLGRALADQRILSIPPSFQQTPVWCWATVAEMYLRYKKVRNPNPFGNMQCAIVSQVHPMCNNNCGFCANVSAPYWEYIVEVIQNFPMLAGSDEGLDLVLVSEGRISPEEIVDKIEEREPIVVGISPSGVAFHGIPQHVALIVGYSHSDGPDDDMILFVNDPFPNHPAQDPYLMAGGARQGAGRYRIRYSDFMKLNWTKSAYN